MVFDTRLFIKRIQCDYPEIFDTNNAGFKQSDDKNGAWEKIAAEFKVDSNFCKKKFRTLRERFTRELRKSYLEPTNNVKYEYFKDLSFLSPYIKFRSITFESADGKTVVMKREDLNVKDESTADDMKLLEQDTYYAEDQDHQTYLQENGNGQNIIYESTTIEQVPEFSGSSHEIHEVVQQSDEETPPAHPTRKRKDSNWEDFGEHHDNKYFAMSVACSLKRLTTLNNLKAKMEIYQVLERISALQQKENLTVNKKI